MNPIERTEHDLAVDLLRSTPTHENRSPADLRHWAAVALDYGRELAQNPFPAKLPVRSATGGVTAERMVLAEYHARTAEIVVYDDALKSVGEKVRARGWDEWFPPRVLRAAAIAHEVAHHELHGARGRELKRRLDLTALRIGRWRVRGHVAGADELVAHSYAQHVVGMTRSPLLLTTALVGG
ncbi:hypothetical protein [Allokutzneria oryzae]|uniref:Uncharacterized protein n=1 Tax=Allokutzneria oryzae TaxID=1378989 RepID=A0ABV5ZTW1_9PSEU